MSIEEKILRLLFEPRFKYKGMSVSMLGLPAFSEYKKSSVRSAIHRLKKNEYIGEDLGYLKALTKSREYLKRKQDSLSVFAPSLDRESPKNLLVMFDIPEGKKAEREWFRFHLKKFGYKMIQRSVWVGPSPLPKDFLEYLKEIKLRNCIKTFRLAKPYK